MLAELIVPAGLVLLLDQASKLLIARHLAPGQVALTLPGPRHGFAGWTTRGRRRASAGICAS